MVSGEFLQPRQELGLGGHYPAGDQHRLDHDGGDVGAMLLHEAREGRQIVERRDQCPPRQVPLPVQPCLQVGITAVIGADGLDDVGPSRHMPCRFDSQHAGLGAGVGESDLLDRRNPLTQQPGELDLRARGSGPTGAGAESVLDGRAARSVVVAVNQTEPVAEQVDVSASIHVLEPGPSPRWITTG